MSQINTYTAERFVRLIGDTNPSETDGMRTGIPQTSTTALSAWHCYKSFAWFDADQIASDMHNRRVALVEVSLTTSGAGGGFTAGTVPIRLYQTAIRYDASKTGHISANTLNPAAGMTAAQMTNEYFRASWLTQAVKDTDEIENAQLCAGSEAMQLVAALADGYALGTFDIPDRTAMNSTYNYRHVTDISITVHSEPLSDVTKPTSVQVLDTEVRTGGTVRIAVSGAEQPGDNLITGYFIKKRYQLTQTGNWSNWSNSEFYALAATEGVVKTTVTLPGAKWAFAVATTSALNTTDYVDAVGFAEVISKDRNRVCLYDLSVDDYTTNGIAVMRPTACTVSETAGGAYELTMTHPIDPDGVWAKVQNGFLLKVRCPVAQTEQTVKGETEVWKNNTQNKHAVYAKAAGRVVVTYTQWDAETNYEVGAKVSTNLQGGKNFQCLKKYPVNADRAWRLAHAPTQSTEYWKEIDRYKDGSSTLTTVAPEQEFYKLEDYSATWLRIQTYDGIEGYIEREYCAYVRTETVPEVAPRSVKEQLFRIYSLKVDSKNKTVEANARHVSYDLSGNICKACKVNNAAPATAIAMIRNSLYTPNLNTIATNLSEDDGTITQDYSWKNPIKALLDPDSGVVGACKAKVIRDNWDIFILRNTEINRGVVLAYGKNLKGVTWTRSVDQLITRVIPFAKKSNGEELLLDDVAVDSPLIDSYPVIYSERLSVDGKVGEDDGRGGTWTEETLKAHMQELAEARFGTDHADAQSVELDVDFVLLGDTEEYRQYRGLQKLYMYDMVRLFDPRIGLEQIAQVSKTEWDVINQRYSKITLGTTFNYGGRTVAGYSIANGGIDFDKINPAAIDRIRNG